MKKLLLLALLWGTARAVSIEDENGTFTLESPPQRIVALEYSFVDALVNAGVPPIALADDNEPERLLPPIRERLGDYQSVGTRSQPNLEVIAQLKPDLIIADRKRHGAALAQLQAIAPTVVFNSLRGSYTDIQEQARRIARLLGKETEMAARLDALSARVAAVKKLVPAGQRAFVAGSGGRSDSLQVHSRNSYSGALLTELGFTVPPQPAGSEALYHANLEQVLALNPQWIFVANYAGHDRNVLDKWQQEPLWQAVDAVKGGRVIPVDGNVFVRGRGLFAAEAMLDIIEKQLKALAP